MPGDWAPGDWAPGDQVLYRYWRGSVTWHVHPMTVVEDGPDWTVLWLPPGTPVTRGVLADGSDFRSLPVAERFVAPRHAEVAPWEGTGILKVVARVPAAYSVWLFWDAVGGFRGWYGNLEQVQDRWTRGAHRIVDTSDHALDVWCPPDRNPVWKDEDEFAVTTGMPAYWDAAEAAAIRAQGEALMAMARRGDPPFDHRWTGFRPDPSWPAPDLPADWAVPRP